MIKLEALIAIVEEKMKKDKIIEVGDKKKKDELQKLYLREQDLKILATKGSVEAREFTKNKIYFILNEMKDDVNKNNINNIILQYHINYFKNIYTGDNENNIRKEIDSDIEQYFQRYSINEYDSYDRRLSKLAQIIYQELYGFSVLDDLIFESELNEVACNRYDYIWIQFKGIKRRIPNTKFKFSSEDYYSKIVENRLVSTAKEEMNAGEPVIYATLQNGFRVTALRPPLSRYFVVNIRLFVYKDILAESRNKFMEEKMMNLIRICAKKGRRNIGIIGEMGSGKTTAADELVIRNLDDDLAIGLAENIHELNISKNYINKNVVELQYTKNFKPSDVTEIFFRLNRDIVIYGEIRNHMETLEMIKAMLRQARGSLFTFHSSSTKRMIHDLRQLLMQTGYYTDYREAQFDVADAVDMVIHIKLDRSTGVRYVYKISEVIADDKEMSFKVNDLFIYDKEKKKYLVYKYGLSKLMLDSCCEYEFTLDDLDYIRDIFNIKQDEEKIFEYIEQT